MTRAVARSVALLALVACAACESSDPNDDVPSAASVYVAVIRHLDIAPPGADEERPIVYVADMNSDPLDLETQVEVIGELEADVDVRFVDGIEAAVDTDDGAMAGPDDGWLVAVGTPVVDAQADLITLRVEASEPDDEPIAWQVRLDVHDDVTVVESEELDAELLVPPVSP